MNSSTVSNIKEGLLIALFLVSLAATIYGGLFFYAIGSYIALEVGHRIYKRVLTSGMK